MEDFLGYNIECIRPPERLGWGILFIRFPSQVFDTEDLAGSAKSSKGCESEISKPEKCNILGLPSQVFDMEDLAGEAKQNNPPAKAAEQQCSSQNVPHGGSLQHCKIFASRMLNRERRPVKELGQDGFEKPKVHFTGPLVRRISNI